MAKLALLLFLMVPLSVKAQFLRPLDDSDPEMKQLLVHFFDLTPCGERVSGLCPEALALLKGGGDRLAAYLITQHEANEREGFPNRGTYLRLLGYTESETAFEYLVSLLARQRESASDSADVTSLAYTIEALGRTRDLRVVPIALDVLDSSANVELRGRALDALDRVQSRHGPQAEITTRLQALVAASPSLEAAQSRTDGAMTPDEQLADHAAKMLKAPGRRVD
jgi:hypothetical protein